MRDNSPDAPARLHVLLVEDQDLMRDFVRTVLGGHDYEVTDTAAPLEALRLVEEGLEPDLLLTDIVMPDLDGVTLAEKVQQRRQQQRVLFISGYSPAELPCEHPSATGKPFLQKPFTSEQLLEKVREALAAPVE